MKGSNANASWLATRCRVLTAATRGFSLVELLVVVGIMLVVAVIAMPSVNRGIQIYRLSGATTGVANVIQSARYEAIRQNRNNPPVTCRSTVVGGRTIVWVDTNNNFNPDSTEVQYMLPNDIQFIGSPPAPSFTSMGYPATQVPAGSIAFDARGTVNYLGGPQIVYVMALGYTSRTGLGVGGVSVTPFGKTQVWSAPMAGPWIKR